MNRLHPVQHCVELSPAPNRRAGQFHIKACIIITVIIDFHIAIHHIKKEVYDD